MQRQTAHRYFRLQICQRYWDRKWYLHRIHFGICRLYNGQLISYIWLFRSIYHMNFIRTSHEQYIKFKCTSREVHMNFIWSLHELHMYQKLSINMNSLWTSYEILMNFVWNLHDLSNTLLWVSSVHVKLDDHIHMKYIKSKMFCWLLLTTTGVTLVAISYPLVTFHIRLIEVNW